MKKEEGQFEDINKEYAKVVQVKTVTPTPTPQLSSKAEIVPQPKPKPSPTPKSKKPVKPHEPDIEGQDGFVGRRPEIDPFVPGEEIVLSVNYFAMSAGDLTLSVLPYKIVNNRKAYHFTANVVSNRKFSLFYSVNNTAETFMDFEDMVPITLSIDNNESSRLVESKTYFDWKKNQASLWEKRVSKKEGEKKKQLTWDIEPFSQSTISALFYLRAFKLYPGKKFAFRVANDGKNVVFKGEVIRKEKISTDVGDFDALVVQPEIHMDGSLKPSGDILIWLSDDERKFILKVESKVKVGTLVGKIKSLKK